MKSKNQKGILMVDPGAPVNQSNIAEMATSLKSALSKAAEGSPVEINLSQTEEIDSGTLKFLVAAAAECRASGSRLTLRINVKTEEIFKNLKMSRHADILSK